MKYLFLETIFDSPHLETSAEIALDKVKKKNNIFFSWIGDDLPWSDWSLSRSKKILGASVNSKVSLIKKILYENKINITEAEIVNENKLNKIKKWACRFNDNLTKLKKYSYEKQNLGLGVSSSLISFFHQSKFDTKKIKKLFINVLFHLQLFMKEVRI